jgi:hypothetical protein
MLYEMYEGYRHTWEHVRVEKGLNLTGFKYALNVYWILQYLQYPE